jgi:glycosyltransferase involved in cell wall biosynthesis
MTVNEVTPVLLTFNEEPNLRRTLEALTWAKRVVIVDSNSADATREIARGFSNVDLHIRPFVSHQDQWQYAIRDSGITSRYVLALDADMRVTAALLEELIRSVLSADYGGALIPFELWSLARPLRGSLYPPQLRLFRQDRVEIGQAGHTQTFQVTGRLYRFKEPLIHDDRKPIDHWIKSQTAYSALECHRLNRRTRPSWKDRLRAAGVMPLVAGTAAYLRAGGPWVGKAAYRYALERFTYESLLAMRMLSGSEDERKA